MKNFYLKISKIKEDVLLPSYGTEEAAGMDLYAYLPKEEQVTIYPHHTVLIPLGIQTEFPKGYAAFIFSRSGISYKKGLAPANKVGIIDSDYRGQWMIALHNHSNTTQIVSHQERIAQVIFSKIERPIITEVTQLTKTKRQNNGFGSTGK